MSRGKELLSGKMVGREGRHSDVELQVSWFRHQFESRRQSRPISLHFLHKPHTVEMKQNELPSTEEAYLGCIQAKCSQQSELAMIAVGLVLSLQPQHDLLRARRRQVQFTLS